MPNEIRIAAEKISDESNRLVALRRVNAGMKARVQTARSITPTVNPLKNSEGTNGSMTNMPTAFRKNRPAQKEKRAGPGRDQLSPSPQTKMTSEGARRGYSE